MSAKLGFDARALDARLAHAAASGPPRRAAGSTEWHVVTPEFPPQLGGVGDYTYLVAGGLAAAGDVVHVWCSGVGDVVGASSDESGRAGTPRAPVVHRDAGTFAPADLQRLDRRLTLHPAPRRLLVQWVPHGYGRRSMNVAFCRWVLRRARRHGDIVDLVVHEPFLRFAGSWRQWGAAAVHRLMAALLLRAAARVWVTIPAWGDMLRPYAFGRPLRLAWLPVPSTIPVAHDPAGVAAARARVAPASGAVVGHFGTYGAVVAEPLAAAVVAHLRERPADVVLLLGRGGEAFRGRVDRDAPGLAARMHAAGPLDPHDLSLHLQACDMMLQPYPDGVSARRTSVMAALAHDVPIVTTRGPLTEDLWERSDAVSLAPAGDTAGLVAACRQLLDDDTLRARRRDAGRRLYAASFDAALVVARLRAAASEPAAHAAGSDARR